ncbi:sphingolipid ceramide N-deacylase [Gordonia crocea]|nr:sphingolipid ceramide N-deacylase [Gordonia crocea]
MRRVITMVAAIAVAATLPATAVSSAAPEPRPVVDLAGSDATGRCTTLDGLAPGRFQLKAAGLGTYLAYRDGRFLTGSPGKARLTTEPSPASIWRVTGQGGQTGHGGPTRWQSATGAATLVRVRDAAGCRPFPEAQVNVAGAPFKGTGTDGNLRGFVDSHAHLTSWQFLGGKLHCGAPFSPYGIAVALRDCPDHEPNGWPAVSEHILSRPGPHDTSGWPTFTGWPRYDSLTHEQTYYRWIERAWRSGLRVVTNYYVQNRVLCERYPLRNQPCDEMESVRIQHRLLHRLQDYIDAQAGGPGKGFFRIATSAAQVRSIVAAGRLAVTLGVEVSEPFGCRSVNDRPHCTRADIDRGLDELKAMGVRQLILTHKFDNALGGTRFDQGTTGAAVNAGQLLSTGHPWQVEPCRTAQHDNPVLGYPRGRCNIRGLTPLGAYTVNAVIARRLAIDVDHLSVKTATAVLDLAAAHRYPGLVSSHTWTDKTNYRRILGAGGFVGLFATPAEAEHGETGRHGDLPPDFLSAWRVLRSQRSARYFFGVGFGPDMGGLGKQAHPRPSAKRSPVRYPFTAADGHTRISRQVTGRRVFDVNTDGTAHYGLLPDWIESLRIEAGRDGPTLVADLFSAAEAYARYWERLEAYL